jgi:polysaccharide pyruvyl transferase CsaB
MRKTDSRILITGSYGQGNTGDEAILTAIVDQLRVRMPDARLVVVAGDTESTRRLFGVETVWWADWAAIAQAVQQSDMVIQGGGGIFFDYTGFHPWNLFENGASDLAHYGGFSLLANLYRKPFMIYGVGVGPLTTDGGREMVKVAHLLADRITVRDAESKSTLEEIGVEPDRIEGTADPAFSLRPADESRAWEILSEHGIDSARPIIAVTLRPWDYGVTQSEWERSLADGVSGFAHSKQAQILLIPFHKGYDDGPLLRVRDLLADNETFVLRSEYMPHEIAGVIGVCDLLIGMRLHSILFAILTATPAIALAYDPKVRSLTRRTGHGEICLDLTELSRLKDLIASVWERREELSSDFTKASVEMRLLSERNADLACDLLNARVTDLASNAECGDMFAKAFYGRLQAVRVRDRVIAKQDEAKELRGIIGVMEEGLRPQSSRSSEVPDSKNVESLREFLDRAVTESTEHLVVIYKGGFSKGGATGLVEAFVNYGIPTIFIGEVEQSATHASQIASGNFFRLSVAAVVASADDMLCVSTPRCCRRVLILRSSDLNTFRLINHAHARNWVTVYFPDNEHELTDPEAERYIVKNAEYLVVGSESLKVEMQSIGAQEVRVVTESESAVDQVAKILELVADAVPKSPVRLAIEGANHG